MTLAILLLLIAAVLLLLKVIGNQKILGSNQQKIAAQIRTRGSK